MGSRESTDEGRESTHQRLARKVRMGGLLEIYGGLLTERQRDYVRMHHGEDMSLGEIAREFGVSRQAVHDSVCHAEAAMERYEEALGLLGRARRGPGDASERPDRLIASELASVIEDLDGLRHRLASQGIIYDAGEFVRSVENAIRRLRNLAGEGTLE